MLNPKYYPTKLTDLISGDLVQILPCALIYKAQNISLPYRQWVIDVDSRRISKNGEPWLIPIIHNNPTERMMILHSMGITYNYFSQIVYDDFINFNSNDLLPSYLMVNYLDLQVPKFGSWCSKCINYCRQYKKQCVECQYLSQRLPSFKKWATAWK